MLLEIWTRLNYWMKYLLEAIHQLLQCTRAQFRAFQTIPEVVQRQQVVTTRELAPRHLAGCRAREVQGKCGRSVEEVRAGWTG